MCHVLVRFFTYYSPQLPIVSLRPICIRMFPSTNAHSNSKNSKRRYYDYEKFRYLTKYEVARLFGTVATHRSYDTRSPLDFVHSHPIADDMIVAELEFVTNQFPNLNLMIDRRMVENTDRQSSRLYHISSLPPKSQVTQDILLGLFKVCHNYNHTIMPSPNFGIHALPPSRFNLETKVATPGTHACWSHTWNLRRVAYQTKKMNRITATSCRHPKKTKQAPVAAMSFTMDLPLANWQRPNADGTFSQKFRLCIHKCDYILEAPQMTQSQRQSLVLNPKASCSGYCKADEDFVASQKPGERLILRGKIISSRTIRYDGTKVAKHCERKLQLMELVFSFGGKCGRMILDVAAFKKLSQVCLGFRPEDPAGAQETLCWLQGCEIQMQISPTS